LSYFAIACWIGAYYPPKSLDGLNDDTQISVVVSRQDNAPSSALSLELMCDQDAPILDRVLNVGFVNIVNMIMVVEVLAEP
jgi:hypothetical protein